MIARNTPDANNEKEWTEYAVLISVSKLVIEGVLTRTAVYDEDRSEIDPTPQIAYLKAERVSVSTGTVTKQAKNGVDQAARRAQKRAPGKG